MKREPKEEDAAFTLEDGDRFHRIILSDPIRYEQVPDAETILCFYVIRRESGNIDIFNVVKTFQSGKCVSRNIQSKMGIPTANIGEELKAIQTHFSKGIKDATGFTINWNVLDLASVTEKARQMQIISDWGISVKRFAKDDLDGQ